MVDLGHAIVCIVAGLKLDTLGITHVHRGRRKSQYFSNIKVRVGWRWGCCCYGLMLVGGVGVVVVVVIGVVDSRRKDRIATAAEDSTIETGILSMY